MLFLPAFDVIPTFPTCAIYSLRTIHTIALFMPSYHLCLAPSPHVLGPREVKDACVALPVI